MSPSKSDLERFRDSQNPSLLSLNAALWQHVIETRELREAIERKLDRLTEIVERVEKAVSR